jgi:hypothetical protein
MKNQRGCRTHGREENAYKILIENPERNPLEDLGAKGRAILQ